MSDTQNNQKVQEQDVKQLLKVRREKLAALHIILMMQKIYMQHMKKRFLVIEKHLLLMD